MNEQRKLLWLCVALLLFETLPGSVRAQGECRPIAEIVSAQGEIRVNGTMIDNATASRDRSRVCAGDLVSSGERSRASLAILTTDAILRIDQNTEFRIDSERVEERSFLELIKGALNFLSPAPVDISVKTAAVNAAVEGTEFHVRVEGDKATVTVLDGQVRLTDSGGGNELTLRREQAASARIGQPPTIDPSVNATNVGKAVQWAHFYPPVINLEKAAPQLTEDDAEFHVRQAALALSRGGVVEAEAALATATTLDSGNEDAWALELIIELSQFDRTPSKAATINRLVSEGERRELKSSAALVALSYAQQWRFDLDSALASLTRADKEDPDNPVVIARLAELWLAMGDDDRALSEATRASAISSTAHAQTVLGYVYLSKLDMVAATKSFKEAIGKRPDDPLPHLGLGLAMIRGGDLDNGTREIITAYGLDQPIALIRSYLGKAFFEQKRDPLDGDLYAEAKALDPNDPTPWFYNAIRLQTINRPVQALHELRDSIEKNDNRAVYRSRFLLDQDLAARSAAVGRVFGDLGFEQSALINGWRSVNADPSDFSGHRFLADTYSVLPRHEVARVSELLQSQLLQPTNITPIQPQLTETNFFVLSGAGPSEIGFNEFNPIFTRDGIRLQANAVIGNNGTVGNDIVVSGIAGRYSFSVGQYGYQSDGIRENNDQDRTIYNVFAQAEVSASTGVQIEYRRADAETGDIGLLFDSELFSPNARNEDESEFGRIGFRHSFSPGSDLIANVSYSDAEFDFGDSSFDPDFGFGDITQINQKDRGWNVELQHIYKTEQWRFITGAGAFEADRESRFVSEISFPFPPFTFMFDEFFESSVSLENLYFYAIFHQSDAITWTLGLSADRYDEDSFEEDQLNPKLGLTWQIATNTTIRAAAFRSLTRPLIANQTIEPTQVAGFNQFFDGIEGEEARRFGLAIDQRFSERANGGLEYSQRELDVPIEISSGGTPPSVSVEFDDWEEQFGRAYLHWTPTDRLAVGIDYIYENFERRGSGGAEQIARLETHRVPVTMGYFLPVGLTGRITATLIDQEGDFARLTPFTDGDDFVVVDATASYRFPKRYGSISLIARNLFDKQFQFQDTDPLNPRVLSDRLILVRINLSF